MISEDNTLVIADIQGGRGGGTPVLTGTGKLEPEQEVVSAAENSASEDVHLQMSHHSKQSRFEGCNFPVPTAAILSRLRSISHKS